VDAPFESLSSVGKRARGEVTAERSETRSSKRTHLKKKPRVRIFLKASSRRARGVRREKTLSASLSASGRALS